MKHSGRQEKERKKPGFIEKLMNRRKPSYEPPPYPDEILSLPPKEKEEKLPVEEPSSPGQDSLRIVDPRPPPVAAARTARKPLVVVKIESEDEKDAPSQSGENETPEEEVNEEEKSEEEKPEEEKEKEEVETAPPPRVLPRGVPRGAVNIMIGGTVPAPRKRVEAPRREEAEDNGGREPPESPVNNARPPLRPQLRVTSLDEVPSSQVSTVDGYEPPIPRSPTSPPPPSPTRSPQLGGLPVGNRLSSKQRPPPLPPKWSKPTLVAPPNADEKRRDEYEREFEELTKKHEVCVQREESLAEERVQREDVVVLRPRRTRETPEEERTPLEKSPQPHRFVATNAEADRMSRPTMLEIAPVRMDRVLPAVVEKEEVEERKLVTKREIGKKRRDEPLQIREMQEETRRQPEASVSKASPVEATQTDVRQVVVEEKKSGPQRPTPMPRTRRTAPAAEAPSRIQPEPETAAPPSPDQVLRL